MLYVSNGFIIILNNQRFMGNQLINLLMDYGHINVFEFYLTGKSFSKILNARYYYYIHNFIVL